MPNAVSASVVKHSAPPARRAVRGFGCTSGP
jgi:hypothetical protein